MPQELGCVETIEINHCLVYFKLHRQLYQDDVTGLYPTQDFISRNGLGCSIEALNCSAFFQFSATINFSIRLHHYILPAATDLCLNTCHSPVM